MNIQMPTTIQNNSNNNSKKWEELLVSIRNGEIRIVFNLIQNTPEIMNYKNHEGKTPLMIAICSNSNDKISLKLIELKCNLDYTDDDFGLTALLYSIQWKKITIALKLIENGCKLNCRDKYGNGPLILSIQYKQSTIALKLIEFGCEINGSENGIPLLFAIQTDETINVALKLIEFGCELNCKDEDGWTALMLAIKFGRQKNCISINSILLQNE